jgi:Fe2+ or Zn2+ uptake regulation protein
MNNLYFTNEPKEKTCNECGSNDSNDLEAYLDIEVHETGTEFDHADFELITLCEKCAINQKLCLTA